MQTSETRAMDRIFQETWAVLEMHFLTRPHLMGQAREELARYFDSLPDGRSEQHVLKDLAGQPLYEISSPLGPHLHRTVEVKKDGQTMATVQEALFNLGGDKFTITLAGGQALSIHGDWMNRVFQVKDAAGQLVIDASRMWFSIRDSYGIQIQPGFDVPLGLAIVVALERAEAQERGQQSPLQNLLGGIGPF